MADQCAKWSRCFVRVGFAAAAITCLSGCANFFVSNTPTTPPPSTTTGNYVLAVNPGLQTLSAYTIGTSTLTLASGSPVTLQANLISTAAPAVAVTVSRNNAFVYVGGVNTIYCYSLGSTGVLTLVGTSSVTTNADVVSMDTSPDGQWLFALDASSQSVYEFTLNPTTGAIGTVGQVLYSVPSGVTVVPKSIHATATLVAAALGTGGDALFTLNTATGLLTYTQTINLNNVLQSDNDLTLTINGLFLFVSRSGYVGKTPANGVAAYSVSAAGLSTPVGTGALTAAGTTSYAILLDGSSSYLYVANRGDFTVSQYTVAATGVVAPLATPTLLAGETITSLARDSTGKYVFAGGVGSTTDLQMYTFDATTLGKLDSAAKLSTGADTIGLQVAATH